MGIEDIRPRDVRRSVLGGLGFGKDLVGASFEFEPSIGLMARRIDKLGLNFRSFREPLTKSITRIINPSIKKNFAEGGRPEGWEPLSAYTISQRGGEAWPILVRSGKLRRTVASAKIWDIGQEMAVIRKLPAGVWYGNLHQAGYGGFKKHMAAAVAELGEGAKARDIVGKAFDIADEKTGGKHAKVQIPQRQFILFQDEDVEDIQQLFLDWMNEKVEVAQERLA